MEGWIARWSLLSDGVQGWMNHLCFFGLTERLGCRNLCACPPYDTCQGSSQILEENGLNAQPAPSLSVIKEGRDC